jgi:hypothetical protein
MMDRKLSEVESGFFLQGDVLCFDASPISFSIKEGKTHIFDSKAQLIPFAISPLGLFDPP